MKYDSILIRERISEIEKNWRNVIRILVTVNLYSEFYGIISQYLYNL